MAEYIGCRNCGSPNCKGCNIYTLATMLENGKFDCLMNGNRSINPAADVVEVVHGYSVGDVCFYGYGSENKSLALVEIVKILNDDGISRQRRFGYVMREIWRYKGCFG